MLEIKAKGKCEGCKRMNPEIISDLQGNYEIVCKYERICDSLLEIIEKKGIWRKCEEKQPPEKGWYLVTLKNGGIKKAYYRKAELQQGGEYWEKGATNPIAWMPLPEPYKEDK